MRTLYTWLVLVACSLFSIARGYHKDDGQENQDWEELIFTQHWPITVCEDWKNVNKEHSCTLPNPEQTWTIHGVWPTKLGTLGPQNCNNSWNFDVEQVKSIEPALIQLWLNIEKDTLTYALWAHEWTKHGTCAAQLPALASEFNYFGQGLRWQRQYSMNNILAAADLFPHPTKQYSVEDFHRAIKTQLGVEPVIQCKHQHGYNLIFELRICFNKKFELIDCNGVKLGYLSGDIITNCPSGKGILYPAMMPSVGLSRPRSLLIELYKFVTLLQWFTY